MIDQKLYESLIESIPIEQRNEQNIRACIQVTGGIPGTRMGKFIPIYDGAEDQYGAPLTDWVYVGDK